MSPSRWSLAVVAVAVVATLAGPALVAGPVAGAGPASGAAPVDAAGSVSGDAPVTGAGSANGAVPVEGAGPGVDDRIAQAVDADSVRMAVALRPDGDAHWTVTYRVLLETDNETAAFESLQADVAADPENYTDRFAARMRSTASTAENATGREMTVRNVTVDARTQELGRTYGILEYTFEWTNFGVASDGRVEAGDAIAGLFLDGQTTLVFRWPAGYGLETARPEPAPEVRENRTVGWVGPRDFQRDEPRVVVSESASTATDGPGGGDLPVSLVVGGLVVALGLAAVALWVRRQGTPSGSAGGAAGDDGTATAGGAGPDDGGGEEGPPEELLSNEEKVLKLVRDRGGRVKQQEIVDAFDWTEAKTSQVVRDLREEGDLEGFRLGRENVLRLPEEGEDGQAGGGGGT